MHIFQLINIKTRKVHRELHYKTPDDPLHIIKTTENAPTKEGWYIFDEQGNAYLARYVKHTIKQVGDNVFYKMYFRTKSEPIETVIY